MKNFINILTLLLCVFVVSCGDDDNNVSDLNVLSSDVSFGPNSGSGKILVAAAGAIEATSDQEWCTVSVTGDVVTVTVTENGAMTGRTAGVTISSGSLQTLVPVSQSGCVLLYNKAQRGQILPYAGGSATVEFKSNINYTVEIPEEAKSWLSYAKDEANGTLTFTALSSTDNLPRGAAVVVSAGDNRVVYHIGSYELKDIAGDWKISFLNAAGDKLGGAIQVVPHSTDANGFLIGKISKWVDFLPLVYKDGALRIMAGVKVRTLSASQLIYTTVLTEGGFVFWEPVCSYTAFPSSIDGKFALAFGDDGTIGSDYVNGFAYWLFSGTPSEKNSEGYMEMFINLVLAK